MVHGTVKFNNHNSVFCLFVSRLGLVVQFVLALSVCFFIESHLVSVSTRCVYVLAR